MKLYHYGFKKEILDEGIISYIKHNDTKIINNLISNIYDGECFGRDDCVFLNLDFRDIGEVIVSVDLEKLNSDLLYVANQDIANDIYNQWYRGNNCDSLVKKYVESIKKFKSYSGEYENPEIMYLGDIDSSLLNVEHLNEEFFEE